MVHTRCGQGGDARRHLMEDRIHAPEELMREEVFCCRRLAEQVRAKEWFECTAHAIELPSASALADCSAKKENIRFCTVACSVLQSLLMAMV